MANANKDMNILDLGMDEIINLGSSVKNIVGDKKIEAHIGVNLGNLLTKTWGADGKDIFYTSAVRVPGELSFEEIQSDDTLIRVNGVLYRIGLKNTSSGNFAQRNHDDLTIVGVYAIVRQLFALNKKNVTSTGNSRYKLCCAKIGLGLSPTDFDIIQNQRTLFEMFDGKNFIVEYMKVKTIVNVEVMNILQEGHCHIRFYSANYKYDEVVLFDVGCRTFDFCRFVLDELRGRNVIAEKTSLDNAGTLAIMKKIMKRIGEKKVKLLNIESLLKGNVLDVDGLEYRLNDFEDIIYEFIREKVNELQNVIDVELTTVNAIVIIGGGAELFQKYIQDMFPGKKVIVPENAQYLNAEAYYIASHKKRNFKKIYE